MGYDVIENLHKQETINEEKISDQKLIDEIRISRRETDYKKMLLPEAIALKFDITLRELEFEIQSKSIEVQKEWILYKEALKLKFAYLDKDSMNDMKQNYQLGVDNKSFPSIGFYFGDNEKFDKALDVIIKQTQLQREKNLKEAKTMNSIIMSSEEEKELKRYIGDEFDE